MTLSDHSHSPLSLISDTGHNLQFHLNIEPGANQSIGRFNESILALMRAFYHPHASSIRSQNWVIDGTFILMIHASYRDCAGGECRYSVPDGGQRDPVLEIVNTLIRGKQRE